jgi:hypothetical protein
METFGGKKNTHTHTHSTTLLRSTPLQLQKQNENPKKTLKNDKRSKNPQKFGGETETEESCERERRRLFRLCNKRRENLFSLLGSLLAFVWFSSTPSPHPSPLGSPFWLHLARCAEQATTLSCVGPFSHPSPRKTQPTTLFVESCGVINTSNGPLHMHMPYKSTLPTPSCLLPTPHSILTISLYLSIYLFHLDWLVWFFFLFNLFFFFFFLNFCVGGVGSRGYLL